MKKKTVELLQRIAITATTVVYGVSFTGNLIALENADAINSALGTASFKTVKSEDAKRILDFISGVAYANGADIKMMAQKTFAIMPRNVGFSGVDLMSELENNGYSF